MAAAVGKGAIETLPSLAETAASSGFIPKDEIKGAFIEGWEAAVEHFLDDGELSSEEEASLVAYSRQLSLTESDLDRNGAHSKLVKAAVLSDVMNGRMPSRFTVSGTLPFNFQKGEHLIWIFGNVFYLEDKTRREYVGRSSGVSIRIARGVYYRTGAFRGHPVERTETVHIDTGHLAVTSKHLYFAGSSKSLRVRHDKIISFVPYSDGVGIIRDAATAKPQTFTTGDGWFTYNLLSNVSQL